MSGTREAKVDCKEFAVVLTWRPDSRGEAIVVKYSWSLCFVSNVVLILI